MLALLLIPLALAGRADKLVELQAAGAHAEVIETVAKWEKGGALGEEAAAILALRDRSALALAEQVNTIEAYAAFRQAYPRSTLVPEALAKEGDLAFAAAQADGSSEGMRAFLATYPGSEHKARAEAMEDAFAFQEAVEAGTPDAIAAFMSAHPNSPYSANAWESLAARTPGIHVRLADGLPRKLDPVPVVDGRIAFPKYAVVVPARPIVATNLPGTARGGTSEWWGLYAVDADGTVGAVPPVGRMFEAAVGAAPPLLLELTPLPGVHAARVAAPPEPLVIPGSCTGKARFAYVLTSEGTRTAFPFSVDCRAAVPEDAATPGFLTAFAVAEGGDALAAEGLWHKAAELPAGGALVAWMGTLAEDPLLTFIKRRPSASDVLVWDGTVTTWWHDTPDGPQALATREGLWLVDGSRLWTWVKREEPWEAAAGDGCKAARGTRATGTLVDVLGGTRVDIAFTGPRGGAVTPRQAAGGAVTLLEESTSDGCPKPIPPTPSTTRLPGDRMTALAPPWAAPLTEGKPGHSVVSEGPWRVFTGFQKADPMALLAPAPEAPAQGAAGAPVQEAPAAPAEAPTAPGG